ncbi:SDR family NAD(P)-dependent oxidoreductase, partial [Escherichia coli]|nr:SDR family NAD(P)-dependent oxidoreductase [Escherichia coli]
TSAIARATARLFAERGDRLYLVARDAAKLDATAQDLQTRGAAGVDTATADLGELEQHEALLENAAQSLGGLDIVLIAHGTLPEQGALEHSYAATERELRTNFLSVVSLLTPLANRMEAQKSGTIAVIS